MGRRTLTTEEFIERAVKVHGDKYDYSEIELKGMTKPISFKCNNCGHTTTITQARFHTEKNRGCDVCSGCHPNSQTTALFLKRLFYRTDDLLDWDFSKFIYKGNQTKSICYCDKGHKVEITPNDLLFNIRCATCFSNHITGKQKEVNKYKSIGIKANPLNMDIIREIQNNRISVDISKYENTSTNLPCECTVCGHKWNPRASYIFKTKSCPKCNEKRGHEKLVKSFSYYKKKIQKIHGDTFIYDEESYIDSTTPMRIYCKVHGWFNLPLSTHLRKARPVGCPDCGRQRIVEAHSISQEDFLEKAQRLFPELDYSNTIYNGSSGTITVICEHHGEQTMVAQDFLRSKYGCPECAQEQGRLKQLRKAEKRFFKKVKTLHPDFNFDKFVYVHSKVDGWVECPVHGFFEISPVELLQNIGCPLCNSSKGEKRVANFLNENAIEFIAQKTFPDCKYNGTLKFDFFLPEYNIMCEYDGRHHYESVDYYGGHKGYLLTRIRDHIKDNYCRWKGIEILRIPYWDFDNIEQILDKTIRR